MKIRLLNLLLIGSIVSSVMLSSCKKDDDGTNPPTIENGTFTDSRDSKVYKWVKIGDQVWMAENLAYTGSDIQHIEDNGIWENNSDNDGWCYYTNDEHYGEMNGVLYQWEAAKTACPSGWHLPTNTEWTQLVNYLKQNGYSYDGVIGHDGIAKSLASDSGWDISDNEGAVGNTDFTEFRNKTGFSALQTGLRNSNGDFFAYSYCMWWNATEDGNSNANSRGLSHDKTKITYTTYFKQYGFSVRCVKD